jgi:hypothetical protein
VIDASTWRRTTDSEVSANKVPPDPLTRGLAGRTVVSEPAESLPVRKELVLTFNAKSVTIPLFRVGVPAVDLEATIASARAALKAQR